MGKSLLLVALCLGLTLPGVSFDFVGDDYHLVSLNPVVTGPLSLDALMNATVVLDQTPRPFYRPVQFLAYALEHSLFGLRPWGYHLVSVLLHLLNVLLVFRIGSRLFPHPWAAFWGSALFAVHPVHAEAVAFVSSQGDLLGALFVLLAFQAVMAAARATTLRGTAAAAAGAALACLAAVLSKETAMLMPIVFLAYLWLERGTAAAPRSRARAFLAVGFGLGLSLLFSLGLRLSVLPGLGIENSALDPGGALRRFAWYARLLVDPTAIRAFWPPVPAGWSWLSVAGALLVSAGSIRAFWPGERRGRAVVLWLWFVLALLPTLKLLPYPGTDLAARYLYLPSIAAAWGVTMIAPGLAGAVAARLSRRGAAALAAVALLGLSFLWYREQSRWRDRLSLYERIAGDAPEAAMPHYNLGNVMREAGRIDAAAREYRTALRLDPGHPAAHCNLGVMLAENVGDPREALRHLHACLALSPQAPNRGRVLQLIRWLESQPPPRAPGASGHADPGGSAGSGR